MSKFFVLRWVLTRHLARKSGVRFEVKWQDNFPEIPFENCGVPSEVLLFFRSERNGGNFLPFAKLSSFQSLVSRKQLREIEVQMVSTISFSWFADFVKTLTIIQRSSQPVYPDK